MSDSVQMPALGESVTEGTVTRWLKQVGDTIEVDEPLLEVSTDKVDTEIPSPVAGTLLEILVEEDDTVEVGTDLARIGSADEASGAPSSDGGQEAQAPAEEPAQETADSADSGAQQQAAQVPEEVAPEPSPEPASSEGGQSSSDAQDVTLPALGESVTEGTVTRWLKSVGDSVEVDEPLLEISTDKVDTEIPSPVGGTVVEILAEEDDTVEVGAVLARVGTPDAQGGQASAPQQQEAPAQQAPAPQEAKAEAKSEARQDAESEARQDATQTAGVPEEPAQRDQPVEQPKPAQKASAPSTSGGGSPTSGGYLTPLVRKLAAEKGVDLSTIEGTGVGGRIRKEDVLQAAEKAERERTEREAAQSKPAERADAPAKRRAPAPPEVSPLRGTTEKASRLRQIIAERMVDALHSMAQLTTVVEVDVTRVAQLRASAKADFAEREGVNLTYLPFFVLAATEALKAHPKVNGVLKDKEITYHGQENVGIAVDTDRGLIVPVIHNAGDLNLAGIARKISELATRTRDNKATPDDLSGATFTITNTGSGGALFDTPIVPGGTSAILGTGSIVKRPVVAKDEYGNEYIAIRSMCYLMLSYDHRLVDGADASRYLASVKKRLEEGAFEAELGL